MVDFKKLRKDKGKSFDEAFADLKKQGLRSSSFAFRNWEQGKSTPRNIDDWRILSEYYDFKI